MGIPARRTPSTNPLEQVGLDRLMAETSGRADVVIGLMSATTTSAVEAPKGVTYASVPGQVGGQDIFGPYEVVKGWRA